mgnify:CR=1 FL=1
MQQDRTLLFEETPIPKAVATLAVPTILSSLVMVLYNLADTYFVGMLNDPIQNAAVTLAAPVMLAFNAVNNLFGVGSSSRALGRRDYDTVAKSSTFGFWCAILSGLAFSLLCTLFKGPLLGLLGADATTRTATEAYMFWTVTCGAAPAILNVVMAYMVRSEGSAMHASIGTMSGCFLNIILDPIFIFGLDLGISGAAIATLLSQCVSASILASFFLRGQSEIRVSIRCVSTAPKIYLTIFKSGMPSFFRQGMASVSAMALNFNAGVYGDAAVAAMAIVTKVFNFLLSAVIGFGQGMQPVVGYNYGAKELGRVRQAVSFSLKFCTVILTVAAAAGAVFAPQIVQFFRNDPAVVAVGTQAFRFQCISLPLAAVLVFANMLFQSLGKSWRASLLALCRQGMFFIPLVYLLPMHFGLLGLEVTQMCSDLIAFLVSAAFLLHYFRREFDRV